jgi:hypothetical protein
VGAVVILYDAEGGMAVCAPNGSPVREILETALVKESGEIPTESIEIDPRAAS